MSPYKELFSDWKNVQSNFEMQEPEPDEVFAAFYDYADYSGASFVAYRNGDSYFIVEASHCSCYGLEGSWSPEEFKSREVFIEYLKKRDPYEENLKSIVNNIVDKLEAKDVENG